MDAVEAGGRQRVQVAQELVNLLAANNYAVLDINGFQTLFFIPESMRAALLLGGPLAFPSGGYVAAGGRERFVCAQLLLCCARAQSREVDLPLRCPV